MRLFLIILSSVFWFTSCKTPDLTRKEKKAIRKIQQSQIATDSLIRWYVKTYPQKNDTTYRAGRDTTILKDTVIYDSVFVPVATHYRHKEIHYKDRLVRDTIEIIDKKFVQAFENRLQALEGKITMLERDRDVWKHKAQNRLWIMIAAIAICSAITFFVVKEKLKSKIQST
jgi:hypothetical protein